MKIETFSGRAVAGVEVPGIVIVRALEALDSPTPEGQELASTVSASHGSWTVLTATTRGSRRLEGGVQGEQWQPRQSFVSWSAARAPELWILGPSPLRLSLSVFVGPDEARVEASGPDMAPLLDFARVWIERTDTTISGPEQGLGLLHFRGGPLDELTFKVDGRQPLPDALRVEDLGDTPGSYLRGTRTRSGGPFAMNWSPDPT